MSPFAFSSDRPLRVLLSAQNPEFKSHVTDLVSRAYYNIHNKPLSSADNAWANAMVASAVHICADERVAHQPTRALVHMFEDIIRVSEEHLRESRRHASMATNAFYLRETVLDNMLSAQGELPTAPNTQSTVVRIEMAQMTRLRERRSDDA